MNQQKNYRKNRYFHRFFVKQISFLILILLFFSLLSSLIIPIPSAETIAIQQDDPKTQPTNEDTTMTDTDTKTPTIETKTETTVEPTQTTSSPTTTDTTTTDNQAISSETSDTDTESTTDSSTTTNDDTTTSSKLLNYSTIESTIDKNSYNSSLTPPKSSYEVNLIDKTIEIMKLDSTNDSIIPTSTSTCNLYLEGEIGNISKNTQVTAKTYTIERNKSFIKEINFTVSTNQEQVRLTLLEFSERPGEVITNLNVSPSNKIYRYVDVKLTANDVYIGETGIATMTFVFTVEKEWVETNHLDKDTIVMMRYHNDTWRSLNTTFINESEKFLYFKAETPGLSVFAVVGDTIIEDSDAIVDGSTRIPIWISFGVIASSSSLLGFVLLKKRFIYRR